MPAHQWVVDYSQTACTLGRRVDGDDTPIIAFNASLGAEPGELVVVDAGPELEQRLDGEIQVRLDDGPSNTIRGKQDVRNGRSIISFSPMPEDFLARVAGARQLSLGNGHETLIVLPMPNANGAVEQLSRCNDDLLQSWGVDVAARRALSRKPRARNFDWAFAIMPRRDTNLVFVANVSARGVPLDCRVVVSSQNPRMDQELCTRMRGSARFEPALDGGGHPIAAQYVTRVRWIADRED